MFKKRRDAVLQLAEKLKHYKSHNGLLYRGGKSLERIEGKTIILVDDGVATGGYDEGAIERGENQPSF